MIVLMQFRVKKYRFLHFFVKKSQKSLAVYQKTYTFALENNQKKETKHVKNSKLLVVA